jgi:hypothetical protein
MLNHLTADWDHLPTPKRTPPGKWKLAIRKAMETFRPTFTYGDERDKLQRQLSRRRQKAIASDEHRLRIHERRLKAREAKRRAQGITGVRALADKVNFRKSIFVFATPSASKPRRTASAKVVSTTPKVKLPQRSASAPQVTTRRPPASRNQSFQVHSQPTHAKGPRVVYVTTPPVQSGTRPQLKTQSSDPGRRRQHVTVQTLGPQRSASHSKVPQTTSRRR